MLVERQFAQSERYARFRFRSLLRLPSPNLSAPHSHAPASFRISSRSLLPAMCAALPVTNVWREAEVLPQSGVIDGISRNQIELRDGRAQRVRANLRHDRVRSLPDIDRALMQGDPAIALQSDAHRRRIGQRSIAAPIPHACDANSAAQRALPRWH